LSSSKPGEPMRPPFVTLPWSTSMRIAIAAVCQPDAASRSG
jgi:hypothetical protein